MSQLRGIEADFATWRPVAGRKVLQLIFEVPIEQTEQVLKMLGVPQPGESKWCAIALLKKNAPLVAQVDRAPGSEPEDAGSNPAGVTSSQAEGGSPKKSWSELSRGNQCGILCSEEDFCRYLKVSTPIEAAEFIRAHFKIASRTDLNAGDNARRWDEFVALYNLHRDRLK